MADERDRQIGALSGGQRRRVFLAKALAARPDLYLLDEPVTGVDVTTQEDLMRILEAEAAAGRTVVATTHDLASAAHHFHQAAFINGRVVAFGPADLVLDPALLAATYGGHVIVLPAGERTIIDDAHHHDRCARRRAALPRRGGLTMLDFLLEPMTYGFMQRGLVAAILVGIVCAVMGAFVVLRGLAFIGDAVSHAAFPGLVIAFILGIPLYIGGAIAAVGTALAIGVVARRGALRFDTAVGVLFAGMFAFGIVLFSTIQGYVTDLFSYLLGNVLGITTSRHRPDRRCWVASSCSSSRSCARSCCMPRSTRPERRPPACPWSTLDYLLLGLIGVTIVVSIQAVGIIMVVAMLVTPGGDRPAARRQVLGPGQDRHRGRGRRGGQRAVPELLSQRRVGRLDRAGRDAVLRACPALLAEVGLDLAAAARAGRGVVLERSTASPSLRGRLPLARGMLGRRSRCPRSPTRGHQTQPAG